MAITWDESMAFKWRNRVHGIKKVLGLAFFVLAAILIVRLAATFNGSQVFQAIRHVGTVNLLLALLCAGLSYLVYACVDLFARSIMDFPISTLRAMAITFVCYAFNQNLGSWVGSIGFRYRLYSRCGLEPVQITRILGLSLITNWSGYFLLAGLSFLLNPVQLPSGWEVGTVGLRIFGAGMLTCLIAYLGATAFSSRRTWMIRGVDLRMPPLPIALTQIGVSSLIWFLVGGTLFSLLHEYARFPIVLTVFFLASIASAAAHIPAGLGVIEAVFFGALHSTATHSQLLAALLVFRVVYYLVPLGTALIVYLLLETNPATTSRAFQKDRIIHSADVHLAP